MNIAKKIIILVILTVLYGTAHAMQTKEADRASCETPSRAWGTFSEAYPGANLGSTLADQAQADAALLQALGGPGVTPIQKAQFIVNVVGVGNTSPLNPLGSPNRVSSGIIYTDLQTINTILSNAPQATVGGTVQNLLNRIAAANPGLGPFNSIEEYYNALGW